MANIFPPGWTSAFNGTIEASWVKLATFSNVTRKLVNLQRGMNEMKIQALAGCQNDTCAGEVSYSLDMVRLFDDQPICENCYDDGEYGKVDDDGVLLTEWNDLPPVKLSDLSA